jgi:glucosaminylphosphatidylinositol acyltransferase
VSEYGTSWNFFVTLCAVWLIADVMHRYVVVSSSVWKCLQSIQIPLFCLVVMSVYQYFLTFGDLTDFILHAPRGSSFFASNREGILSLCGYTPMYLMSEWFSGRYFFNQIPVCLSTSNNNSMSPTCNSDDGYDDNKHTKKNEEYQQNYKHMQALLAASAVCGVGWWLSAATLQPTSRRLTNMPFVFMILCLASLMLVALLVVDMAGRYFARVSAGVNSCAGAVAPRLPITTMEIFSKHQLVVFMIANLLTGAVNMSMKTLDISDNLAFCIVFGYITVVVVSSWIFDKRFCG